MTEDSGQWDIKGKVCLVTGANSGLGKETVLELIRRGAGRVIMACRNMTTGQEALDEIREKAEINDEDVEHKLSLRNLNLASLNSVRRFAQEITDNEKELHVLINNAGVFPGARSETEDGFELAFGTNQLGHFLLTTLLLDLLKSSKPSRIVILASTAYRCTWPTGIPLDDVNFKRGRYSNLMSYCRSKLANILFAKELHRRLNENGPSGISVYSVHPGVINTGLYRNRSWFTQKITSFLGSVCFSTNEQGIATTIHCTTKPGIENESGNYYERCAVVEPYAIASDPTKAKELWEICENLVKLFIKNQPMRFLFSKV